MAQALSISGIVNTGSTSASMSFLLPGQDYILAAKNDDYSLEYDIRYSQLNQKGWDSIAFTMNDELGSPPSSPYVDQEGLNPDGVAGVNQLFERMQPVWYRRIMPIGRAGRPGSTGMDNFRVGIWVTHPTGAPVSSTIGFSITNLRVTLFRETVLWLWREGMAVPTADASANVTSPGISTFALGYGTLPAYCSNGKLELLDDIQSRRYAGSGLNSTISWDSTKQAFTLSNIRLTPQMWWDLMTFYEIFRRDPIIYQHQANLPAMLCRFVRPPSHEEATEAGKLVYIVQLVLQQR